MRLAPTAEKRVRDITLLEDSATFGEDAYKNDDEGVGDPAPPIEPK